MCDVTNAKEIVEELLQYLDTAEFAMREELSLKAAILAEKFAPQLLCRYVDVILQLIDKAGDFVSDDIWYRVVQFVTNNEDLQSYAATKAREYLDKPALHETIQVSAYLLGEYGHLLARRPGCSPKELFAIINDKLPTVSASTVAILLSTYAKILMHTQPPDVGLQQQILTILYSRYESYIDVEIQQRAVEYFELSRKGPALADVLAEMPKFPEPSLHC
ncbi:AP-2 complex subunit alpha-2 [Zea mays]|uniref:AP-2 complex subunit alpha-2 n=1 Tax=Zea mays TaxID=4577 RepID=A0A1D6JKZ7_MAIZE|nr:AP-2 complex subunit alpha-2 [Zea mays]